MPESSVLIVEDDPVQAVVLLRHFEKQGFSARHASDGPEALNRIGEEQPDAIILDVNLPGKDGFEVCEQIRTTYRGVILMLTSRQSDLDRVHGLELGADDYLVKPVSPSVVLAHLGACLRRTDGTRTLGTADVLQFGRLRIDRADREVHLADREVVLTTAEFDLLWMLAESAGNILSRDQIMAGVRRIDHDGLDRSIDMRVSRLRKRLGDDPDNPHRIKTVRGKGYLFSKSAWD